MKVLILCGGKGTRLRSVIDDRPKPLAPVNGVPFLTYQLNLLKSQGFKDIVLCTGYMHKSIESTYGDGSCLGVNIRYSKETKPLGTGGAILKAIDSLEGENFLVLNGDTLLDVNYKKLVNEHKKENLMITLALVPLNNLDRYGGVTVDEKGYITAFQEKGVQGKGIANGGAYMVSNSIVRRDLFGTHVGSKCSIEKDIFPSLVKEKLIQGVIFDQYKFVDIGTPKGYKKAQSILKDAYP